MQNQAINHSAFFSLIVSLSFFLFAAPPDQEPLIQKSDFSYIGAFALPQGDFGGSRFGYGGSGLGFYRDSVTGAPTLFMQGHAWYPGFVAQIKVPADSLLKKSNNVSNLSEATVLQNFYDVTDSKLSTIGDGASIYGTLGYKNKLIVGASMFYDASGSQTNSHGVSSLNLAASNDFLGFFPMSGTANPRSKGGYMTVIPAEWQTLFGGPALTGKGGLPIISANSCGPSATVFNPADVGAQNPIPGTTLLFYPLSNPLFSPDSQNPFFNLSTEIAGIAFPAASSSVLFFGKHGTGPYCYGCGCSSGSIGHPSCAASSDCPEYCYDPAGSSKGTHAYPYIHQVWAYDATELLKVKNGSLQTYQVSPYAMWRMDEMDTTGSAGMAGAAYDPGSGRLYITENYGEEAHVHVYQITVSTAISLKNRAMSRDEAGLIVIRNQYNPLIKICLNQSLFARMNIREQAGSIAIFDVHGDRVYSVISDSNLLTTGITWNSAQYPSGMYMIRATVGELILIKQVTLAR